VAVISVLFWRQVGLIGVEAGADGIALRRQFGIRHQSVPWSDIKTFRIRRAVISPPVCAELWSGELVKTALVQGRKMRWRGGASRDMVSVLTSDLAGARVQGGATGRTLRAAVTPSGTPG
jgi:Bacterial PH domain